MGRRYCTGITTRDCDDCPTVPGTTTGSVARVPSWDVASPVRQSMIRSPALAFEPATTEGSTVEGDGWKLTIAPGWMVKPGERKGDFVLVRNR